MLLVASCDQPKSGKRGDKGLGSRLGLVLL
eukprot:COSAG04_NODE_25200_length_310_cov_43587.255924_1_plen_29_part_10